MSPFSTMNSESRRTGLAIRFSCGLSTKLERCAESIAGNRFGQSRKMGIARIHPPNTSSATSNRNESLMRCITPDHSTSAREFLRNRK